MQLPTQGQWWSNPRTQLRVTLRDHPPVAHPAVERARRHEDVADAAATHGDDHVGVDADEGGPLDSRGVSGLDRLVEGATGHRNEGFLGGVGEENERLRGHRGLLVQRVSVGEFHVAVGRAVAAGEVLRALDLHGNDLGAGDGHRTGLRALRRVEERRVVELLQRLRGGPRQEGAAEEGGREEVAVDEGNGLQRGRDDGERGVRQEIVVGGQRREIVAMAPARKEVGVGEDVVGGERGVDLANVARRLGLGRRGEGVVRRS